MTFSEMFGRFAADLTYESIPRAVRQRAVSCFIDTLGCAVYGSRFPWSAATASYASLYGGSGQCTVFGRELRRTSAPLAAFANGAAIHAFEQDSLRYPGAGVHPGVALVPPIVAACEETGADGVRAITAFVAACEVLFRIGAATCHSSERLGFHAPGLTGPLGAAIAAGMVHGLNAQQLSDALGIAASMSAGLLAFTKSRRGAMVKRLHMGRAAEAGIVAARLAAAGYEGPETILEGQFGFLEVYCERSDKEILDAGLRREWESLKICMKRYPCHVTVQAAIQALRRLMAQHGFGAEDVAGLTVTCHEKVLSHHDIRQPGDIMSAQYSFPFSIALAMHRDPDDPDSFDESALRDVAIQQTCDAIELKRGEGLRSAWSSRLTVSTHDGREFEAEADHFTGMPSRLFSETEERARFLRRTEGSLGFSNAMAWYDRLADLEGQAEFPVGLA